MKETYSSAVCATTAGIEARDVEHDRNARGPRRTTPCCGCSPRNAASGAGSRRCRAASARTAASTPPARGVRDRVSPPRSRCAGTTGRGSKGQRGPGSAGRKARVDIPATDSGPKVAERPRWSFTNLRGDDHGNAKTAAALDRRRPATHVVGVGREQRASSSRSPNGDKKIVCVVARADTTTNAGPVRQDTAGKDQILRVGMIKPAELLRRSPDVVDGTGVSVARRARVQFQERDRVDPCPTRCDQRIDGPRVPLRSEQGNPDARVDCDGPWRGHASRRPKVPRRWRSAIASCMRRMAMAAATARTHGFRLISEPAEPHPRAQVPLVHDEGLFGQIRGASCHRSYHFKC